MTVDWGCPPELASHGRREEAGRGRIGAVIRDRGRTNWGREGVVSVAQPVSHLPSGPQSPEPGPCRLAPAIELA